MKKPHVLIVGSGFAGMSLARRLTGAVQNELIDLTIVDKVNAFVFTPLLHEVATGALNAQCITEPLMDAFGHTKVKVIKTKINKIDLKLKKAFYDAGTIDFDYVVLATGSRTNIRDIPGVKEHSLFLKDLADALLLRDRLIDVFETKRSRQTNERPLSFVVVGGGPTGVELIGEMQEFIKEMEIRKNRTLDLFFTEVQFVLVNSGTTLLETAHEKIQKQALNELKRRNIKVILNRRVKSIDKNLIQLSDDETLAADLVVWAAGVKAQHPEIVEAEIQKKNGRLVVDKKFLVQGTDCLYAIGDVASYDVAGEPLPMLAQVAVTQSKYLANNLFKIIQHQEVESYSYHSRGFLISIGKWYALGNLFFIFVSGKITWWLWRTIYLFNFHFWKKRLRIAFEWTIRLFTPRDVTNLIYNKHPSD